MKTKIYSDKRQQLIFRILNEKLQKYVVAYTTYNKNKEEIFKSGWKEYRLLRDAIEYLEETFEQKESYEKTDLS